MNAPRELPLTIAAATLQKWLADGDEIALIDLREEGLYGAGHPLLASNLPYSRLEAELPQRVPRRDTRIVLVAEAPIASPAVARLAALGYTRVHVLVGGVQAWQAAGHELFESIHAPSKAFAEVVEHAFHTPAIAANVLAAQLAAGDDLIVLDSRTVEEYERFHVPGAVSCPSAELVLRFADLVPSPKTRVVVSCAGRTRGIIGAQALINAGVPNPVQALEGGTQGWKLAGLSVVSGREAVYGPVSDGAAAQASERSADLAQRFDVPRVSTAQVQTWRADASRTTYVFDVRTAEEYADGHVPGAVHVAGGQLVQTLDKHVFVRGARLVLADDQAVRAVVTAHWLRQMGWDAVAWVHEPGRPALSTGAPSQPQAVQPAGVEIAAADSREAWAGGALALSVQPSAAHRLAHPRGAVWVNRSRLHELEDDDVFATAREVLVYAPDLVAGRLIVRDLIEHRPALRVRLVHGDAAAWRAADIEVVSTPDSPPDAERIDFLFWLHDRHLGNADASRAYLAWEGALPGRIGQPASAGFRLQASAAAHPGTPAKAAP